MARSQSASLDRKKFFGDPVLVITIIALIIFLALFILYPLAMLLMDSVLVRDTHLYSIEPLVSGEKIVYVSEKGEEISDSRSPVCVKLTSPTEGIEERIVPLYNSTGLFAGRATMNDVEKGNTLYLKTVNSKDKAVYIALDQLTQVQQVPQTYRANGRVIKKMDGIELSDLCIQLHEDNWTLDAFPRIFSDYTFNNALRNTLLLGCLTGLGSLLIGLLFAYVDVYVHIRSRMTKKLFDVVSLLPVVSPPFVLSLSMMLLFGRSGLITRMVLGIYDSDIYGLWGITIVQTLTFFPVVYRASGQICLHDPEAVLDQITFSRNFEYVLCGIVQVGGHRVIAIIFFLFSDLILVL